MTTTDAPINTCGAWIEVSTAEGRRRVCTLAAGHYTGPEPNHYEVTADESWHTDCPAVAGQTMPLNEHDHEHPNLVSRSCTVWADCAEGAHPSEALPGYAFDASDGRCVRCNHTPQAHEGHEGCQALAGSCPCELSPECLDEGWAQPVDEAASVIEDVVKESGRTLGESIVGGYRADVKIGDTGLSVYGPARFVSNVIHAFADAFVEEAER